MGQQAAKIVRDDLMGGEPRVAGRRITVLDLYEQVEGRGVDPGAVADRYELEVAEVYHALAYYHDHPEEMEAVRERREATIAEHRDRAPGPGDVQS